MLVSKKKDPSAFGRNRPDYFLADLRRARRWLRRDEMANTPLERPAKTRVGFSGVSSQPPWACAGSAATRDSATTIRSKCFFICIPFPPLLNSEAGRYSFQGTLCRCRLLSVRSLATTAPEEYPKHRVSFELKSTRLRVPVRNTSTR